MESAATVSVPGGKGGGALGVDDATAAEASEGRWGGGRGLGSPSQDQRKGRSRPDACRQAGRQVILTCDVQESG